MTLTGIVNFFDESRGFGFIRPDGNNGRDLFVHISGVSGQRPLQKGERVSFEVHKGQKGQQAVRVIVFLDCEPKDASQKAAGEEDPRAIIDPPVGRFSSEEEIRAWISELRRMPNLPEVRTAIEEAERWLSERAAD